ncbi:MAG: hypothetical protein ACI8UO_005605 [Verrucomicrobiales bacterium]|jgi:hypothetical protein
MNSKVISLHSLIFGLLLLPFLTASAQTVRVKPTEGAKFDGYKIAFLAITADSAQGQPIIQGLLDALAAKGVTAHLGFPQTDAARVGAMTLILRGFNENEVEIAVIDSKSDKFLAKINTSAPGDAASQAKLAPKIIGDLIGEE